MNRFVQFFIITFLLLGNANAAPSSAVDGAAFLKVFVVLVVVVAVMIGLAFFAKRSNLIGSNHDDLKVIASLPLGQHEKAVVIKLGEEQMLLGVSSGNVRLLQKLERKIEEKDQETIFSKALSEKMTKGIKFKQTNK